MKMECPVVSLKLASDTVELLTKVIDFPKESLQDIKPIVSKYADALGKKIAANKADGALEKFCHEVSVAVAGMKEFAQVKKSSFKKPNAEEMKALLQAFFKDLIKPIVKPESLGGLEVIVEAAKLKEMKAENLMTIRMRVSEQGMEWINSEGQNGETVSRLLPE